MAEMTTNWFLSKCKEDPLWILTGFNSKYAYIALNSKKNRLLKILRENSGHLLKISLEDVEKYGISRFIK